MFGEEYFDDFNEIVYLNGLLKHERFGDQRDRLSYHSDDETW